MAELDVEIDDDELAALALAADPDQVVGPDAVPISSPSTPALLPEWYMPAPRASGGGRARRVALVVIMVALVIVNGAGLCVTYGLPEIAW